MSARKIKPEVLRPLILVIVMIVALFVLQFLRPVPPDIRQENLQKVYAADLQNLYAAVQQYQGQYGVLPGDWSDLLKVNFALESLELPDAEPKHPVVVHAAEGVQVRNMPFVLVRKGQMDLAGPRKPLIEFGGGKDLPPATLYSNGTIEWGRRG